MNKTLVERLPPLPESFGDHYVVDSVRIMREPGYTAEQMREYAAAALRATGEGEWPDRESLRGLWRAMIDAGGAMTVARHGAGARTDEWAKAVSRGMLAIEYYLHPERRDSFPGSAPTPAEPLLTKNDRFMANIKCSEAEPLRDESRFFIDHGIVHDRLTGKHLRGADEYGDKASDLLAVLQELENRSLLQITRAKLRQQIANDTDDEPEASSPLRDAGAVVVTDEMLARYKRIHKEAMDRFEAVTRPDYPGRLGDALDAGHRAAIADVIAQAHPAPQQPAITASRVERAYQAFIASRGTYEDEVPIDREDIRAALNAAQEVDRDPQN